MQKNVLFLLLMTMTSTAGSWESGDEDRCPLHGVYVNGYGFSVILPPGLKGCPNSPVGMSDHGTFIPLDKKKQRSIEAYAGYNAVPYATVEEAVAASINFMREDQELSAVTLVSKTDTSLGGLPAQRFVLRYQFKGNSKATEMVRESVETLRSVLKPASEPSHAYSLSLTTDGKHYAEDRAIFERMLASWKTSATDDDPEPPTSPAKP